MAKGKYQEWITEQGLARIAAWKRDGLTDEQIANNMNISSSTFYEWKNKFSEISDNLKQGKEDADIQVENALFKRTVGYTYQEVTQERVPVRDEDGKIIGYELQVTKVIHKEVQPDVVAQIFWLQNRKPETWKDKRNLEMTGKDGGDIKISLIGV